MTWVGCSPESNGGRMTAQGELTLGQSVEVLTGAMPERRMLALRSDVHHLPVSGSIGLTKRDKMREQT